MTSEERAEAARWRREEEIQIVQLSLCRAFHELMTEFRDLDQRFTKVVNERDALLEQLRHGPTSGPFW